MLYVFLPDEVVELQSHTYKGRNMQSCSNHLTNAAILQQREKVAECMPVDKSMEPGRFIQLEIWKHITSEVYTQR